MNYFKASKRSPYHLSAGAVLINKKGEVACHYFKNLDQYKNIYLLMRETAEEGEHPEEALARGLMEEFGAKAKVTTFLGSTTHTIEGMGQKTTLYFLCELISQDINLRSKEDEEKDSKVQWHEPAELMKLMGTYEVVISGETINESEIIQRALDYKIS